MAGSRRHTKLGITSQVLGVAAPDRAHDLAAWVRTSVTTGRTLYVGSYSTVRMPGLDRPCVKVVFPLPNGYALVAMRPEVGADGSLTLWSRGARFQASARPNGRNGPDHSDQTSKSCSDVRS